MLLIRTFPNHSAALARTAPSQSKRGLGCASSVMTKFLAFLSLINNSLAEPWLRFETLSRSAFSMASSSSSTAFDTSLLDVNYM